MEACCLVVRHRPKPSKCKVRMIVGYSACVLSEKMLRVRCRAIARCDVAADVVVDVVTKEQRHVGENKNKVRSLRRAESRVRYSAVLR